MIYITQNLASTLDEIKESLESFIVIDSGDREFLVEHAKEAIKRAYITTPKLETIILISPKFSIIAQNKLLKILEEPPENKEFILITKSKSSLLPTIKSRLPIKNLNRVRKDIDLKLDLENLDLEEIYNFLKEHKKVSKLEAKEIVERILLFIVKSDRYRVDNKILKSFTNYIKALEVGTNPTFILTGMFLKLLNKIQEK